MTKTNLFPGYYTDRRNGDLWELVRGPDGLDRWRWVNGTHWRFVPLEHLVPNNRPDN